MSVKSAIVLCAGRGKRLKPYTDTVPKPLLPIDGVPTLDFIFAGLKQAGIERVVLVTHYLAEQLDDYAAQQIFFNPDAIACIRQVQLAGTADAAMAALQSIPAWFQEPFLLTASDYLVAPSFYKELLDIYEARKKSIAVSLKRLPESEQALRSSVRFDANQDVLEVVEKPAAGTAPSALTANLIYVLPPDIVEAIAAVNPSPRGEKEIQTAINSYLNQYGPASALEQKPPSEWQPGMG